MSAVVNEFNVALQTNMTYQTTKNGSSCTILIYGNSSFPGAKCICK